MVRESLRFAKQSEIELKQVYRLEAVEKRSKVSLLWGREVEDRTRRDLADSRKAYASSIEERLARDVAAVLNLCF